MISETTSENIKFPLDDINYSIVVSVIALIAISGTLITCIWMIIRLKGYKCHKTVEEQPEVTLREKKTEPLLRSENVTNEKDASTFDTPQTCNKHEKQNPGGNRSSIVVSSDFPTETIISENILWHKKEKLSSGNFGTVYKVKIQP